MLIFAMCLAVPMQIASIDGYQCVCEARGIEREVSLFLLQGEQLAPGDHVLIRPGEAIPAEALMTSQDEASSCDLMLVIGTSGEVVPAAQMPSIAKNAGSKIVEINLSRTPLTDRVADYSVYGRAGEILVALVQKIKTLQAG